LLGAALFHKLPCDGQRHDVNIFGVLTLANAGCSSDKRAFGTINIDGVIFQLLKVILVTFGQLLPA